MQKLEDLLKLKNWKEANKETRVILVELFNNIYLVNEEYDYLFIPEDFLNFSCEYVNKIDNIWITYSNGKYGFSVQKNIYLNAGGKLNYLSGEHKKELDSNAGEKFLSNIGWSFSTPDSIKFNDYANAPEGHLPYWYTDAGSYALPSKRKTLEERLEHKKLALSGFLGLLRRIETCSTCSSFE